MTHVKLLESMVWRLEVVTFNRYDSRCDNGLVLWSMHAEARHMFAIENFQRNNIERGAELMLTVVSITNKHPFRTCPISCKEKKCV